MTWTTTWRSLVVLALTAVTVVALVGRCGPTWVVRVFVRDLVETQSLPVEGTYGTPLIRVLGGPFRTS